MSNDGTEEMLQVQIFLDEDDTHDGKPMHEYLLRYLMHHDIRGATLFRATMGFGSQHHLHAPERLGALDERPLMITFVDEPFKVRPILPHFRELLTDGIIITHGVERW
ncbi:MAG: hypothetical protein JWQ98_3509 [Chlorobi bacterium]|nr:hypothetical protein [Chlorobiota bacterium]